jgi:predicted dehydrogenase
VGSIVSGYRDGHERTTERAELFGSKATIVVDDVTRQASFYVTAPDRLEVHRPNLFRESDTFYDTLAAHTRAFLEEVGSGNEAPVPGRDGLRGMEIARAAIASLESGKPVEV